MDFVNFLEAVFNFSASIVNLVIAIITIATIIDKKSKD